MIGRTVQRDYCEDSGGVEFDRKRCRSQPILLLGFLRRMPLLNLMRGWYRGALWRSHLPQCYRLRL